MSDLRFGVSVESRSALASLRTLDNGLVGVGKTWANMSKKIAESTGLLKNNSGSTDDSAEAMQALGAKVLITVTALIALSKVLASATKDAIDFQHAMLKIEALTGASEKQMKVLTAEIRNIAKASIYTASEVANASEVLSKMGITAEEQATVLAKVATLATGTQEDLGKTATVTTKIMNAYNAEADEMAKLTDITAQAVTRSALSIQTYGAGMQYMAGTANDVNLTLEETSAHLALVVNRGQNASRAGRLMQSLYVDMANDGSKFNQYLRDNGKQLNTVSEKMEWLAHSGMDTTTANEIFTRGVARMATTISSTGDEFDKMNEHMENHQGVAKKMENTQLGGVKNQWKIIKSLIHDTSITIGDMMMPIAEAITSGGKFADVIDGWGTKFGDIEVRFGTIAFKSGGLLETFRMINVAVAGFADSAGDAESSVEGIVMTADILVSHLNMVVARVLSIATGFDSVVRLVKIAVEAIAESVGLLIAFNVKFIESLGEIKIGEILKGNFQSLKSMKETGEYFGATFADAFVGYVEDAKEEIVRAGGVIDDIMGKAKEKLDDAYKKNRFGKSPEDEDEDETWKGGKYGGFTGAEYGWEDDEGTEDVRAHWLDRGNLMSDDMQRMFDTMLGIGSDFTSQFSSMMGSISQVQQNRYQADINAFEKAERKKLASTIMSNRRRMIEEEKINKKKEEMQKEAKEKAQKWAVADAIIAGAVGIANAWSTAGTLPPPLGVIYGTAMSGMIAGTTVAQVSAIKSQNFANSGIVEGDGATGGADNIMVGAREGELFLNGRDQKTLFDAIQNGELGGGHSVYIENFSGSDDELGKLEDMLKDLRSAGRI